MPGKSPDRCQICGCERYEDEPRSYCQDCAAVCQRIKDAHTDMHWPRHLPAAERQAREQRVQRWADVVQAKLFPGAPGVQAS